MRPRNVFQRNAHLQRAAGCHADGLAIEVAHLLQVTMWLLLG